MIRRLLLRWGSHRRGAPPILFVVFLLLTGFVTSFVYYSFQRESTLRFRTLTHDIASTIQNRLMSHENALIQTRSFLQLNQRSVSLSHYRKYIDKMDLLERFPGMLGIGIVEKVPASKLEAHTQKMRAHAFGDYKVWPSYERDNYFPITYLEPAHPINRRAIGYDMKTEPVRDEAMIRASRSGKSSMSGRVHLVQDEDPASQYGFIMYLPIYDEELPLATPEEREKATTGFIYSPYRTLDFFNSLFKQAPAERIHVDFEVYSSNQHSEETILYDHYQGPRNTHGDWMGPSPRNLRLDFGGKHWEIVFRPLVGFTPWNQRLAPIAVAVVGLIFSFLFFAIAQVTYRFFQDEKSAAQKLKAALDARDEFLSVASHELKTPLSSLKLQIQLAQRQRDRGNDSVYSREKVDRLVDQSGKQINRLIRLVDDMLDMSRIQTGKLTLDPEEFSLCESIAEVIERLKPNLNDAGTSVELKCTERLVGLWDRYRMEQVITNLLTNTIRYGEQKPVTVFAGHCEDRPDWVRITVQDQGRGISASAREKIFNRFERAENSKEVSGLGLGLYITKQIVESHSGKIWVESEGLGKGSTFVIELPLKA